MTEVLPPILNSQQQPTQSVTVTNTQRVAVFFRQLLYLSFTVLYFSVGGLYRDG